MLAEDGLHDAGGRDVAVARQRFLTVDPLQPDGVRKAILASWWRSRNSQVAADRLDLHYVRDPDLDSPLTRSADPVLRHLHQQLDGQSVAIVLTDPKGVVLSRLTSDVALERQLDRVSLAPGFSYAETHVGTNGIGTALEAGRPMAVFGHEHYAENLEELACAGVPIHHPVSGKTVGLLDLTCWRRDAGPLLMTLARTTAEQIRQSLLTHTGMQEMELLQAYLRASRRSSGLVIALNNDVVMMSGNTSAALDPGDRSTLLQHATEALAAHRDTCEVELPSGSRVRIHTREVKGHGWVAGGVVDVKVLESRTPVPRPGPQMLLPGLVGDGTLWRRACQDVELAHAGGAWTVLEGEPGTGKLALLRALHQRVDPTARFTVVDGADCAGRADARWHAELRQAVAQPQGTVVLRHLDRLGNTSLRVLRAALQDAAGRPGAWCALTCPPGEPTAEVAELLRLFPGTVHVPPLRHHVDDVPHLVRFLLQRLGHGGRLTVSAEAMQLMLRAHWPGNVQQVLEVLRQVTRTRRAGVLGPQDLPAEVWAGSRRRLAPLESMERDAIVLSLQEHAGNKAQAARALGMSRATIYRKMHDFGITADVR